MLGDDNGAKIRKRAQQEKEEPGIDKIQPRIMDEPRPVQLEQSRPEEIRRIDIQDRDQRQRKSPDGSESE